MLWDRDVVRILRDVADAGLTDTADQLLRERRPIAVSREPHDTATPTNRAARARPPAAARKLARRLLGKSMTTGTHADR